MPQQWELAKCSEGTLYVKQSSAVAQSAPPRPVQFSAQGRNSSLQYAGPDGSRHTARALEIASYVVRK
ncbi:hypothetical protein BKA67DRAFT_408448 [Truncatella angustata]|uniref:Uncharacterized protein n=1 Tax=Truncatella angustata TaxID=152316 RepID=A0A9P8ZS64_9PEZI|nr:uncharacterized protein BKA67DRAFT_408448 [Truncatella angustata]KAH6648150.1 hypothetical protein BKA67DRAFT_408448 [Truncatella angustata]